MSYYVVRRTGQLIVFLGLAFVLAQQAKAAEKWWNAQWEMRIPIAVSASSGITPNRPVVISWADVAARLGGEDVRLGSLRLVRDGKSMPFQLDHRDSTGRFLPPGDLRLAPTDELVFTAPSDRRTVSYLYLSRSPVPPVAFASGVSVTPIRDGQAHQRLSTAGLSIDVQGPGPLDPATVSAANHGRASVVGMTWKGLTLTGQSSNWSVVMNSPPFPTAEGDCWRTVKLLVDGPVRKVVTTGCAGSTVKNADGSVALAADVTRYFSMFSGVPLYDVEDVVECTAAQGEWTGIYADRLILGHRPQLDDVLIDGSSGTPVRVALTDKSIPQIADGRFDGSGGLVQSKEVVDGWYAWLNEKDKLGVAVFYGAKQGGKPRPEQMQYGSGWAMWHFDNWVTFAYTGLQSSATLRHRFRVAALEPPSVESIAAEYRLWENDMEGLVAVGVVERRAK